MGVPDRWVGTRDHGCGAILGMVIITLETERLLLRPFTRDDLAALIPLQAEETFWWYPLRRGMTDDETAAFLDRVIDQSSDPGRPALHAVTGRATGSLMGWAGLSVPDFLPEILPAVEVGWRLGIRVRGQGYATEAAERALMGFRRPRHRRDRLDLRARERIVGSGHGPTGLRSGCGHDEPEGAHPLLVRRLTSDAWRTAGR